MTTKPGKMVISVVILPLLFILRGGSAQNDFSEPIKCYNCDGAAVNSSCADPVDIDHPDVLPTDCDRGICLKWTKYKNGVLQMIRLCSSDSDLDFQLTMIDGVCRSERNGNGKLCMCGKHLCNSATRHFSAGGYTLMGLCSLLTTMLITSITQNFRDRILF